MKNPKNVRLRENAVAWAERGRRLLAPAGGRLRVFRLALLLSALAAVYWLLVASDRYVSEAHVIIQRTGTGGQALDVSSVLGTPSGSFADQLLLRDHLLSVDMLLALDAKLDLRSHYSDWRRDPLSRMWFQDSSLESFAEHFRSRVSVEFDEYTGVLVVRAQAYDPETAHAISSLMVEEGERHMNAMAHELAREQVGFLERRVEELAARLATARSAVIAFQNENSLASPQGIATAVQSNITRLESQLTDLQTQRATLLGYLVPASPSVKEIDFQIAATRKQIENERRRLASPEGNTLNTTLDRFQQLEKQALFAEDVYKAALVALEQGQVEATRTLRKVSVLQSPTRPEASREPRRLHNTVVFLLVSLLVAGILNLIAVIIRDHRD
jgi:capsular polysaccharide transport system permease protein